jgi:integrase
LSPRSTKNYRGALATLFAFAAARGHVPRNANPVADTETVNTNGDGAIEIYTPDQMRALLKHAAKDFVPVLALGAFAGLRTAEILRLEWRKDIDLERGFITVPASKAKTASRRLVPIQPNLKLWLVPYRRRKGKVWKESEKVLLGARGKTVKAAGVAWRDNALRHSFCSYRLASIQNAGQTALEAGNSPAMIFKHYRELVRPNEAVEWFTIEPGVKP